MKTGKVPGILLPQKGLLETKQVGKGLYTVTGNVYTDRYDYFEESETDKPANQRAAREAVARKRRAGAG